jgi:hypothetical protein
MCTYTVTSDNVWVHEYFSPSNPLPEFGTTPTKAEENLKSLITSFGFAFLNPAKIIIIIIDQELNFSQQKTPLKCMNVKSLQMNSKFS